VRRYVEVLLDDVGRNIVQPADRDPLLEQGRALLRELTAGGLPAPAG
jgi:hypothetical protein